MNAMGSELASLETLFLALADKTRMRLLSLMAAEPVSVGYLCQSLGDSQPKVSRHLAYLRNCGVVTTRREGKHIYYGLTEYEDPAIQSVFECTVAALAGEAASIPELISKKEGRPSRTTRSVVPVVEIETELDGIQAQRSEQEYEPQAESYSEISEPSDEMDVFLL